jgi:two-component system, NtrC family, response regulator AtoC
MRLLLPGLVPWVFRLAPSSRSRHQFPTFQEVRKKSVGSLSSRTARSRTGYAHVARRWRGGPDPSLAGPAFAVHRLTRDLPGHAPVPPPGGGRLLFGEHQEHPVLTVTRTLERGIRSDAPMKILLSVEDRPGRESLKERLIREGFDVVKAEEPRSAQAVSIPGRAPDLLVMEIRLPGTNGAGTLELQEELDYPVILFTVSTSVDRAVAALKLGSFDPVARTYGMQGFAITVKPALPDPSLGGRRKARPGAQSLVGRSRGMEEMRGLIERISRLEDRAILIQGENGTGKDLFAKAIHTRSSRAERPFLKVTCTGLQETLLEGILFGGEEGAVPDAQKVQKGLFELARGGTVFVDKIGDMSFELQVKVLRVIEERSLSPRGGGQDIPVDVLLIASTDRDLRPLIVKKEFYQALYNRLSATTIDVPPLRDRREDVGPLADHFLEHFSRQIGGGEIEISRDGLRALEGYRWPGNVRELRNVIERAVLLGARPVITHDDLLLGRPSAPGHAGRHLVSIPLGGIRFDDLEKDLVVQALERAAGDLAQAGELLGMTQDEIHERMKTYGLLEAETGPGGS